MGVLNAGALTCWALKEHPDANSSHQCADPLLSAHQAGKMNQGALKEAESMNDNILNITFFLL